MNVLLSDVNVEPESTMSSPVQITLEGFLEDRQGRTFVDVTDDSYESFGALLEFFSDGVRQRRLEESEIHHDRPALAGVVRELESHTVISRCLGNCHRRQSKRLRQAVGVVVRMIMEARGWRKTGRKGSLGVRAAGNVQKPRHNIGGLALWFVRAERYDRAEGMPFRTVRERSQVLDTEPGPSDSKRPHDKGPTPNGAEPRGERP